MHDYELKIHKLSVAQLSCADAGQALGRRFQNDLKIDNLIAKTSGDYDGDGYQEVYWKTNDGTAYLRALMHADGNIQYANYQSKVQMENYLTEQGHSEVFTEIIS